MSDGLNDLNYPIRLCHQYYADHKGKPTRKIPLHKGDIGVYVFVDDCLCGSKHVHSPEPGHRFAHRPVIEDWITRTELTENIDNKKSPYLL